MKRIIQVIICLAVCLSLGALGACKVTDTEPGVTQPETAGAPEPAESIQQSETPEPPEAEPTGLAGLIELNFAHYDAVLTDPDAFKGKTYSSLYQIQTGKKELEEIAAYYALGYTKGQINNLAILNVTGRDVPELAPGDMVYVSGVIQGKGIIADDKGNSYDALWLDVTSVEQAAPAGLETQYRECKFESGEYVAQSGALTIEVLSIDFTKDGMTLCTKTADTSVKSRQTYYIDIVIHQDGCFTWYGGCNFWIMPDGITGFDGIPLILMDSARDMTIEFVPFSEDGKLLYEPLVIEIKLSE